MGSYLRAPLSNICSTLISTDIKKDIGKLHENEKYFSAIVLAGGLDYNWHFRQEIENPYKINFDNFTKFKNSEERIFAGIGVVKKGIARV